MRTSRVSCTTTSTARRRAPRRRRDRATMISFVLPAHNEARFIAACIGSIRDACSALALDYEIIVANDASTDGTGDIARTEGATVVDVELRHIAAVRNAGARLARGDRLIFVDADSRIDAPLLKAAVDALD